MRAQLFELHTTITPQLATTNNVLTYQFSITNNTGGFLRNFQLKVSFSESVDFVSATNTFGTAELVVPNIVYTVQTLNPAQAVQMSLQIYAVKPGILTTYLDYVANEVSPPVQEIDKQIFSAEADLGVRLISPTNTLVAADQITYRLIVTNQGPDDVDAVVVTAEWPTDTDFISITPGTSTEVTDDKLVFTTPGIAAATNTFYDITIQPNQPGVGELTASLYVNNLLDPNPRDNATTNTLSLETGIPGIVTPSFLSGQTFNPQTGLMEQRIRITNSGTGGVPTSRVVISDFSDRVFNAAGTNDGLPFVTLTRPLLPGESADLLLEYFIPSRSAVANPALTGYAVPLFVPVAPPGNSMKINGAHRLSTGEMLVEFVAEPGKAYSVVYSDDVPLTNAVRALPAVTATADTMQWIDAGPPKTRRSPAETDRRFYQVIEIPD